MKIKPGVRVLGMRPEMVLGLMVVDSVFSALGIELVLTSGTEGVHKRASLHYMGAAGDLRLPSPVLVAQAVAEAKAALGDDYDVVLEGDHIHTEFQPKAPY